MNPLTPTTLTDAVATIVGPLAREYGHGVIAHSSVQPDSPEFSHFVLPGVGALPYGVARGAGRTLPLLLGDPLAHRTAWPTLFSAFTDAFGERVAVVQASEAFAEWVSWRGGSAAAGDKSPPADVEAGTFPSASSPPRAYVAETFGAEPELDVSVWGVTKPSGKTRTLRRDARQARALVDVGEVTTLPPAARAEFAAVTLAWRGTKLVADRPLRVFCRTIDWARFELGDAKGGRVFAAVSKKEKTTGDTPPPPGTVVDVTPSTLQAYVVLDPLHSGGKVVGYYNSIIVSRPDGLHAGAIKAIVEHVAAVLRSEGAPRLSWGIAPLCGAAGRTRVGPLVNRDTAWAGAAKAFCWTDANTLYPFQVSAFSKTRWGGGFDGETLKAREPGASLPMSYLCHPYRLPTPAAILDLVIALRWMGFLTGAHDVWMSFVKDFVAPPPKTEIAARAVQKAAQKDALAVAAADAVRIARPPRAPACVRVGPPAEGGKDKDDASVHAASAALAPLSSPSPPSTGGVKVTPIVDEEAVELANEV